MKDATTFIPIRRVAHQLGVPVAWLIAEAKQGNVPSITAGRRLLAEPEAVKAALHAQGRYRLRQLISAEALAQLTGHAPGWLRNRAMAGKLPAYQRGTAILFEEHETRQAIWRMSMSMPSSKWHKELSAHLRAKKELDDVHDWQI